MNFTAQRLKVLVITLIIKLFVISAIVPQHPVFTVPFPHAVFVPNFHVTNLGPLFIPVGGRSLLCSAIIVPLVTTCVVALVSTIKDRSLLAFVESEVDLPFSTFLMRPVITEERDGFVFVITIFLLLVII